MEVMRLPERNDAAIVVTPHPMSLHGQRVLSAQAAEFVPGEPLERLLQRQGVHRGEQWVVTIGGLRVPEGQWGRVRPKHGHLIECRRVPEKGLLRIVAIAALSYFTLGAGGIGGGSFLGVTGVAGKVLAYGAFLAGSLVINKLLAPKVPGRQDASSSPTYSLTASRNRARPFEPMGLVLGEPYAVPDLGAQPYTFFASGEQYLWQIFHLGINCADAFNLRIGQTPIGQYQGVTVLRNGLAAGNSDFPALGTSVDTVAGGLLTAPTAPGPFVTRTSSPGTVRLALDFVAQLYDTNNDGGFQARNLALYIEYREVGSATWLPFTEETPAIPAVTEEVNAGAEGDGSNPITMTYTRVITPGKAGYAAGYLILTNGSQKPLRLTLERAVSAGQYEVRVQKYEADFQGTQSSNTVEWASLRSFQQDVASYDSQSRLAVQIQASGQLNGALDELNAVLRAAPMDYWNGAAWVTATDRASGLCNPGSLILLLARGIFDTEGRRLVGLGYSDSQIDIEGLKRFMVHCAQKNFDFDLYLQEVMSLQDLLDAIAYAGMGEIAWPDGKLGVAFFAADDPIEGVINMANIRARSFSVDYEMLPTADEIEFQYFDRERGYAWNSLRVTAPGVTIPRSTARTSLTGISTEAHAAVLARFSMAQNIFQRKSISCELDLEYMTFRRGAVVALSHDLTQWGYSGRLVAAENNAGTVTLTLSDPIPGDNPVGGGGPRYIGLRLPGETQMRAFPVQSFTGESRTVVLDAPWPGGVDLPGDDPANPAHDTIWIYDFKATPGQRLRVAAIEPSISGARLTLVPESDEFWDYTFNGEYSPPPSNSLLRPAPEIGVVSMSEELGRQGNTFYTELTLGFEISGPFMRAEVWGAIGEGDNTPPVLRLLASGQSQTLTWRGGLDERWHLMLRVYAESRQAVPYRLIYDVQGLRQPPPDVTGLSVNGDVLSWDPVDVPDLAGYLVRFQYGTTAFWNTAVPMHNGIVTEIPFRAVRRPQGLARVFVKAIDTTGNVSANAAAIEVGFDPITVTNPILVSTQSPDFPGDIVGGSVSGGNLVADGLDRFWLPADGPMWLPADELIWASSQYGQMTYEFEVSSTEAGILVLQYTASASDLQIEYQTGGDEPMWLPADAPMWLPADELMWGSNGEWKTWPGSLVYPGGLRVRFRFTFSGSETQGVIYSLAAVIDAPEISEVLDDIVIDPAGTRLPLTNTYRVIRSVLPAVQADGGTGASAIVMDKNPTLGPLVEVRNTAGVAVAGLIDAQIRGY